MIRPRVWKNITWWHADLDQTKFGSWYTQYPAKLPRLSSLNFLFIMLYEEQVPVPKLWHFSFTLWDTFRILLWSFFISCCSFFPYTPYVGVYSTPLADLPAVTLLCQLVIIAAWRRLLRVGNQKLRSIFRSLAGVDGSPAVQMMTVLYFLCRRHKIRILWTSVVPRTAIFFE